MDSNTSIFIFIYIYRSDSQDYEVLCTNTKSWRGHIPRTENEIESSETFSNIVTAQVCFGRTLVFGRCVGLDASLKKRAAPAQRTITPTCRATGSTP